MDNKAKYQRTFLIFNQEDIGYSKEQAPSGYLKIEVKDGRGKLSASVQNLKDDNKRNSYKLYILKCADRQVTPVCVGVIPLQRGRGELKWEFDAGNVGMTGISIADFNAAVVLAEHSDRVSNAISCPLAAYKDKKVEWRSGLKDAMLRDEIKQDKEIQRDKEVQDVFSKFTGGLESKYTYPDIDLTQNISANNIPSESTPAEYFDVPNENIQTEGEERIDPSPYGATPTIDDINEIPVDETRESGSIGNFVQSRCPYTNSTLCTPQIGNNIYNPCGGCYAYDGRKEADDVNREVNIESLKDNLNKYFDKYDPFKSERSDYEWWKVNNPIYLNNILYQYNAKMPLLLNQRVLMAHFKYGYLILGIYTDKVRQREYIVYGVPGVYSVEDNPFGAMCRWVQLENTRPQNGSFGYWLVYIESKSGKVLYVN